MKYILISILAFLTFFQSCDSGEMESLSRKFELNSSCAQELNDFQHYTIIMKDDTINYHTYQNAPIDSLKGIMLYIQGSGASRTRSNEKVIVDGLQEQYHLI